MLVKLLIHLFVKDSQYPERPHVRLAYGILAGSVGIAINFVLFCIKLTVGLLSGSIAMAADAVNNLSDAGSSVVSVLGFKLSAKPADNEHPFGHGRLEYVAGVIVAVIIVSVGIDFLKESVLRIFSSSVLHADNLAIGIFAGTLFFKIWLFVFYRAIGRRIDSKILKAAAFDSLSDLLTTSVVLGAVFAARFTSFPVDGCAGVVVAGFVILGGFGILRDTINPLVGELPDKAIVEELEKRLLACKGICGVHDIILHNYGPNHYFATAHAEVNRDGDLLTSHDTLEAAEVEIARNMPVRLILHCDPYNTRDPKVKIWRARTEEAVTAFDHNFKLYDFRLDESEPKRVLQFQLLIPRNYALTYEEITDRLTVQMRRFDPTLTLRITFSNTFV